MKHLQNALLYFFFFSINFELWDPFKTGIDFFVTKVSVVLYLLSTLFSFKQYYSFKNIKKYLLPAFAFFILLTIRSFQNRTNDYSEFFNLPVFLNLLVLLTAINHSKRESLILLKGLFVFVISTMVITIMYSLGYNTDYSLESRITIFGDNQNDLGLRLSIGILILIYLIQRNPLNLGRGRYAYYLLLPFMLNFMIETGSRVAFISFFLGFLGFIILNGFGITKKKILAVVIGVIALTFVWELLVKDTFLAERLYSSFKQGDSSGRDIRWKAAQALILQNPLWGQGETGYAINIKELLGFYSSPHNVFIEVLCYTGFIGLFIFLNFIFRIFSCAIKLVKENNEILPFILIVPILGMMFTGQIIGTKIAWVIFAFIITTFEYGPQTEERPNI